MRKTSGKKKSVKKINRRLKSPISRRKTVSAKGRLAGIVMPREYMGNDRRSVVAIISSDMSALRRAGLSNAAVAVRLKKILRRAMAAMGMIVAIPGGKYRAVYRESMGRIACPFGDGLYEKGQVEILPAVGDEPLAIISPLSVHLIEKHGFHQGRGNPFRTDLKVLRMLM